jgi:hypothetical protein
MAETTSYTMRVPDVLLARVKQQAKTAGISVAELWQSTMRQALDGTPAMFGGEAAMELAKPPQDQTRMTQLAKIATPKPADWPAVSPGVVTDLSKPTLSDLRSMVAKIERKPTRNVCGRCQLF